MGVVLGYLAVQLAAAAVAFRRGSTVFIAFLVSSFISPIFGFAVAFGMPQKAKREPPAWNDFSLGGALKMVLMAIGGFFLFFMLMVALMTGFFTAHL